MKKAILILILAFILISPNYISSVIAVNDIEGVFPPPPTDGELLGNPYTIKDYVIDATANLLMSQSSASLLLSEVEKSEKGTFDFSNSISCVNDAISKLEASRDCYVAVLQTVNSLEYIEERINQLKVFNYQKYAIEHNLNVETMQDVAKYLSKGDIKGFYKHNSDSVQALLAILHDIREDLERGIKPNLSAFWEILRGYSEILTFGNYATACAREAFNISNDYYRRKR